MPINSLQDIKAALASKNGGESDSNLYHDTAFGKMPTPSFHDMMSPENIQEGIGAALMAMPGTSYVVAGEKALPYVKQGIEAFQPGKAYEQFMSSLGPKNAEENLKELSQRMKFARDAHESVAFKPKKELFDVYGKDVITPRSGSDYLNNVKQKDFSLTGLKESHDKFVTNRTLENADDLRSDLLKEKRDLDRKRIQGTLDSTGDLRLDKINNAIRHLDKDMDTYFQNLPTKYKDLYKQFTDLYRTNVGESYESLGPEIRALSKGNYKGIEPYAIKKEFAFPTQGAEKVLSDIGPSGAGNVLANEFRNVPLGDADALAKAIMDAKRKGGYGNYITPEMEQKAKLMESRSARAELLKDILSGAGGLIAGEMIGHPLLGAVGGYLGKKAFKEYIKRKL